MSNINVWRFERIVRVDYNSLSDKCEALVTLSNDGVEESFFLKFHDFPSKQQILDEANKLIDNKNTEVIE